MSGSSSVYHGPHHGLVLDLLAPFASDELLITEVTTKHKQRKVCEGSSHSIKFQKEFRFQASTGLMFSLSPLRKQRINFV